MSDDNPFEQSPLPCLTVAQQDRAAGLLVGMAVGESMMSLDRNSNTLRRNSGELTDRALVAVEGDQPEPFKYQEYIEFDPWDIRLAFSHATGAVLRKLHLSPDEVFQSAYFGATGDANEMWFGQPQIMGEAFALWAVMLHQAVLTGEADLCDGLPFLSDTRPLWHGTPFDWTSRIQDMEHEADRDLSWAGPHELLHATWAAVSVPDPIRRPHRFASGIRTTSSVEGEWVVGPFIGAALGALHGYSSIPWAWRRFLRDARGNSTEHLMRTAVSAALDLEYPSDRWPDFQQVEPPEPVSSTTVVHPSDPGVLLGGVGALEETWAEAAVSLCNAGARRPPSQSSSGDHAVFWLVDSDDPQDNPNLDLVLEDAARAVLALRKEGKTVLLHGLTGESRTPTVAAHYGALISGRPVWEEFQRIARALPQAAPNARFLRHLASTDMRPTEVAEERPVGQKPLGHLSVDRQLIELFSWTVVADLLDSVAGEGWINPVEGVEDILAVVLHEGPRVEFHRTGAGITVDGELIVSWPKAVALGAPQEIVACIRSAAGLVPELQMITSATVSTWKPFFAASLIRHGYGRVRSLRVQPLAEKPDQLLIYHYSGGPDLLCEVDEFSFVVTRESISTNTTTLWNQSADDGSPDTAACAVLDRILLSEGG